MKDIYFINGTMGVGKTTISKRLNEVLNKSVFLDGDWCWYSKNFPNNEDAKKMVIKNIINMLNGFIECPYYENIVFCWVMHKQSIIDSIVSNLDLSNCNIKHITLICNEETLKKHLLNDVNVGLRKIDIIDKSIERLNLYDDIKSIKIDVSDLTVEDAVKKILDV